MQDDKALYSKVGSPRKFDFIVTFQDVQDLEIVRRKFIKALLNLRSNAEVGRCWMDRSGNLNGYVDQSDLDENMEVMQEYVLDLERHARVIDSLLSRLDGTRKLVGLQPVPQCLPLSTRCCSCSKSWSTGTTSSKSKPTKRYSITETN